MNFPQEFWSMQSIEYETRESLMEEVDNLHASWRVIVEKNRLKQNELCFAMRAQRMPASCLNLLITPGS